MRQYLISTIKTLALSGFLAGVVQAADNTVPVVTDYPVQAVFQGTPATVKLDTEEKNNFRTRLSEATTLDIDFAGEYAITTWGCGSGCLMGAAVSHKTGDVHWLPGESMTQYGETVWDENNEPLTYQVDSALLAVYAWRGTGGEDDGGKVHYYALDNKEGFKYLKSLPK